MMDVYICDSREDDRNLIQQGCTQFYMEQNYDGEIREVGTGDELISMINQTTFSGVFFLDCDEVSDLMIERLWNQSRGSFVVLVADQMKKVLDTITPELRPAGYMLSPIDTEKTESVLKQIFQTYTKESENALTYRFKVKSRIYGVDLSKIDYFEASAKKMILRTTNQEFEFYETFEHITETLPRWFIRTHKSFLVNMKNVKNVDYKEMWISFKDGAKAYISRSYKKDLDDYLSRL